MDTKLKSFKYAMTFKVIAFLLIAISLTTIVLEFQYLLFSDIPLESILVSRYKDSNEFLQNDARRAIILVTDSISDKQSSLANTLGEGYYYYISNGETVITNLADGTADFFQSNKDTFLIKEGYWQYQNNTSYYYRPDYIPDNVSGYIAFSNDYLVNKQNEWNGYRNEVLPIVYGVFGTLAGSLLLLIYLTVVVGKSHRQGELHLNWLDRIPFDVLSLIYLMIATGCALVISNAIPYQYAYVSLKLTSMIIIGTVTFIFLIFSGIFYLTLVKRIKGKTLGKNTIVFKLLFGIFDYFRSLFDGRQFKANKLTEQLFYRQMLFITLSFLMVLLTFIFLLVPPLFLFPPLAEVFLIYFYVKGNRKTFTAIDRGFNESIEDQMRAERLKIQLVTNVSHDLKTPLTSIISYVDLLSKEEGLSENAMDYVRILADKSERLKNIVSDLFDLAKSTSGNIQLQMETIDIKRLVEQTLADMSDEIERSNLQFKTKLPGHAVMINADGQKLYRVLQNLLGNTLKYALAGTRVFVELDEMEGKAIVTLKNTSSYEMNFNEAEIMQRFTRGDDSRSTEGSGLGLSIAESFTHVCGGDFNLQIDGDLFKVKLTFNTLEV
ncbi:MAG: hypothetical protein BGO41_12585 [Clostridiales bacterium 38-18]|nr:MAG: hypothetical protein BGO41_12585 [Clostridiales bacterium 38-18]